MKNFKDEPRKIGVELEFYGLNPEESAQIISKCLGGKAIRKHEALYEVESSHGTFFLETDAKLLKKLSASSEDNRKKKKLDYDGALRDVISFISDEIVPTELITPPLLVEELKLVNQMQDELVKNGAAGTAESFRFAFAAQLNPDVPSIEVDSILKHLKAFIMLSKWLKKQIDIDFTRKLTGHASDFPKNYNIKIFHPDYSPTLKEFIEDYLKANPTRNMGLDLLPLFDFLDHKLVASKLKDERIQARPTFHYRLPNCQLGLRSWNIEVEWQRWLLVEKLVENSDLFEKMSQHFYDIHTKKDKELFPNWLREASNYVELIRS